jgi:N-acetylglutamate synthase-like GNAT family acetyltransferase
VEPRPRVRFDLAGASDRGRVGALLSAAGLDDIRGAERRATRTVVGSVVEGGDSTGAFAATASLTETRTGNYLRAVAVRPDLQGQGLGMLAAAAALRLGDPGRPAFLMTETAPSFFAALGFEKVSAEDLPADIVEFGERQGCSASATAMLRAPRTDRRADYPWSGR